MSLRVWLPLNGDLKNKGLDGDLQISSIGTLTFINNGKIGKCYQRASSSSPTTTGININDNFLNIFGIKTSVAMWVKPLGTHTHYNGTLLSSGNWNKKKWAFGVNQDNTKVDVLCGNYNNYINCQVPIGIWTHLVSVYDNGTCMLYKNGVFVGQLTNQKAFQTDALNTCIGRQTYANGYFGFNGLINDVRIYDHALSLKQVQQIAKGLVLHYKLDDKYIEPTTNLITTEDCLSNTCYNGATKKYSYGANTNMYKIVGIFQGKKCTKLYNQENGIDMYPYVYISNMFTSNGTNAPEYKTLSFDYYTTISTKISVYKLGNGTGTATYTVKNSTIEKGTGINSVSMPVEKNVWNHIEITLHGETDSNAEWGYIKNYPTHTSDTSNYWLFANMQLETKDHATGYAGVGGIRSNTIVYDSSGYQNNGTVIEAVQIINDSPRYSTSTKFNGLTSGILIENLYLSDIINTNITYSFWIKPKDNGGRSVFFGSYTGNSWSIEKNVNNYLRLYWNGSPDEICSSTKILDDIWQHIVITKNGTNDIKVYLNGQQIWESTVTHSNLNFPTTYRIGRDVRHDDGTPYCGKMSDFRIYATALTPEDIKELYQTSALIDRNQNLYVRELVEI